MLVIWLALSELIGAFVINKPLNNTVKCSTLVANYPFSNPPISIQTLNIKEDLKNQLIENGYSNLTLIQEKSIPKIIENEFKNIFIHSETGSGKTLSYAIPLVHLYETVKETSLDENVPGPLILVVVPTRLLESQTLKVFKQISKTIGDCELARNLGKSRTLPGIVIGTIDNISQIFRIFYDNFNVNPFQFVKIAVYDEVDFILQQYSYKSLKAFINNISHAKTILCGATINTSGKQSILHILKRYWKKVEWIESDFVHKMPPTLSLDFHETEHSLSSKIVKVADLCKECEGPKLIFCQSHATASWLYDNLPLGNKYLMKNIKLEDINALESNRIIISTDQRGFDSYFSHVIHFDFPHDILQLIHRCGRAGRAGRKGRVSFIVTERSEDFYKEIKTGLLSGEKLDNFFSRKRSLARKRKKRKKLEEKDSLSNLT